MDTPKPSQTVLLSRCGGKSCLQRILSAQHHINPERRGDTVLLRTMLNALQHQSPIRTGEKVWSCLRECTMVTSVNHNSVGNDSCGSHETIPRLPRDSECRRQAGLTARNTSRAWKESRVVLRDTPSHRARHCPGKQATTKPGSVYLEPLPPLPSSPRQLHWGARREGSPGRGTGLQGRCRNPMGWEGREGTRPRDPPKGSVRRVTHS